VPVASIVLAVELFGADGMLYYSLACSVSYVLSGYSGLYSSQRILYDKLKAQYIDVYANAHLEGERTEAEKRFGDLSRDDER
jgi:H+/Cl- antiporter ClcA